MGGKPPEVPSELKGKFRKWLLRDLRSRSPFDYSELELFEWYVLETEKTLESMLEEERQALESGSLTCPDGEINDSGFVAVEYFIKRVRYSHVVYMASLLESFLERECNRLRLALPDASVPFELNEIKGDKWSTKRKFIERYSGFDIPADLWRGISSLIRLRNLLVHDNGSVQNANEQDVSGLLAVSGLSVSGGQVAVQPAFVSTAFTQLKEVASFIESRVNEVIQRAAKPKRV